MTHTVLRPTLRPGSLTEAERRAALEWLARNTANMAALDVAQLLAEWAHPTLGADRRGDLFGYYQAALLIAADLRDGTVPWDEYRDDLTCAHKQEVAAELAADEAAELLYALIKGEKE